MPTRGVAFARYLRKVHVQWCPFKPRAVAPVLYQEMHAKAILNSFPKLVVSKRVLSKPAAAVEEHAYTDQAQLAFVDGSERSLDLAGLTLRDIMEEIDSDNVRIAVAERARGKPF